MTSPQPDPEPSTTTQSRSKLKPIPILLLKTRSQPDDTYEDLFTTTTSPENPNTTPNTSPSTYIPTFIPVLEHTRNAETLSHLTDLLRSGELKRKYGGMIFTSQRAVEAWTDVVGEVEREINDDAAGHSTVDRQQRQTQDATEDDAFSNIDSLTPFPLYVVGPGTERALQSLIDSSASASRAKSPSPFTRLNPTLHGSHTGNGATLAPFIRSHYNALHAQHIYTYFEAPRLPFIPLLGMSSQNYGRKRLEKDDPRLGKKALLFLVGEVRRDVIPRVLTETEGEGRIEVVEREVYRTEVRGGFEGELRETCGRLDRGDEAGDGGGGIRVAVVFSPQGSDMMLKHIGYLSETGEVIERAKRRWYQDNAITSEHDPRWVIVTIGPTTRDYLKDRLGVEPDACASKPSPEGLKMAIEEFLGENGGSDR